jgi:hypothetical protein
MQRKPTKNTRGPNAAEKRFQGWIKEQDCGFCDNPGPCIGDHARGATFKHNKVLAGHWFVVPRCAPCDTEKTIGGKRLKNESRVWLELIGRYISETGEYVPGEVILAIKDFNR